MYDFALENNLGFMVCMNMNPKILSYTFNLLGNEQ